MSPELIYICGSGHSGSTLLDMILGGHSKISALGEAHRVYLSAHNEGKVHLCACGLTLEKCEFWSAVENYLVKKNPEFASIGALKNLPTTDPRNLHLKASGNLLGNSATRPRLGNMISIAALFFGKSVWQGVSNIHGETKIDFEAAKNSLKVYDAIRQVWDTPIIVDSTKNPRRLLSLKHLYPKYTKALYLLRDGRAVCRSRMLREEKSMEKSIEIWKAEHARLKPVLKKFSANQIKTIKYEDLCRDTNQVIDDICAWSGLKREQHMQTFRKGRHNIGGNPMRFRREERTIRLDEKWRKDLSEEDLKTFAELGSDLNKELGYE